jgi:transcriptional regulator with XRE-family HTH domain
MPTRKHTFSAVEVLISERLKERRILRNMTQEALGELLGMTHTAIWKYENAQTPLKIDVLIAFTRALDMSVGELLSESNTRPRFRGNMDEHTLIKLFKRISPEQREATISLLQTMVPAG